MRKPCVSFSNWKQVEPAGSISTHLSPLGIQRLFSHKFVLWLAVYHNDLCWCFSVTASGMWEFPPQGLNSRLKSVSHLSAGFQAAHRTNQKLPKLFTTGIDTLHLFITFIKKQTFFLSDRVAKPFRGGGQSEENSFTQFYLICFQHLSFSVDYFLFFICCNF